MKNKINTLKGTRDLIISPHADDEVLGCSSILNKDSFVYYCGLDESLVSPDKKHRIDLDKRLREIKDVGNYLGFSWDWNANTKVNHYTEQELIKIFEDLINKLKPERVFIPYLSYNQDHRAVYHAALIVLRPHDKNHFVKKVLVYEQPHVIIWGNNLFNADYFVQIDIDKKIKAYKLHKSQVRSFRSPQLLRAIASIRGGQSNFRYAEGFKVMRWID